MLKRTIIPALIAIFAMVACTKEFENPGFGRVGSTEVHSLSVGIEAGSYLPADETKATMEAIVRVNWQEGDEVSVVNASTGQLLGGCLKATEDGEVVTFAGDVTGEINEGDRLCYIYPRVDMNDGEVPFEEYEISLAGQQYDGDNNNRVCFHGYAVEDAAASSSISRRIKFNLVTAYVHLNMSNLPAAGADLTSIGLSNVNGGFKWVLKDNAVSAEPCFENQGISVTCSNIKITKAGNAVVRFAVPASPETTVDRVLTVNNAYFNSNYAKAERKPAQYYNQIYSTWRQVVEVGTVAAANEAFARGETMVKITSVGEEETLYLPQTTEDVTIDFANPEAIVTLKYGPAPDAEPVTKAAITEKPATVNIATNDITQFVVTGINNIVWLAGNQAALASALNNAVAGQTVALANDITMTENWVSVARGSNTPNFDGRNHAIINMTIQTQEDSYVGLFRTIQNHVTLQNVTFKNAKLLIPESIGNNARGGVLVGHMYPSDVINCHVEGATVVGCQKLGGLIGYIEGDAANATVTVKDCSVKDINISSNRTGNYFEHGVGGFIGHVSLSQANLITIENNTIENVTITGNKPMEDYNKDFLQLVPHVFIGNVCNSYTGEGAAITSHSVVLKNNAISGTNSVLPTCMYSSEYFGWGGNAEERPAWKGKIYIDGQEWTPNYPYQIAETGAKHSTLANALAAATEGQTVQILKAGEYTFPGTQKAIIVEGLNEKDSDDNYVVAFDLRTASGQNKNITFKHLTFNLLQDEDPDRGFTHCENLTYNECVFTGEYWGYDSGMSTFNNCVFHDASKYSIWTYGGNITLNDCEFFSDHGKFVNVYATGSTVHTIYANNCVFHNTGEANKAAFNLKGKNTHGSVVMTGCSVTGNFPNSSTKDGNAIFSDSGLYMFDDPEWGDDVYAKVDGVTYYPYFSMDANGNYSVNNATGLKKTIKHWNALKAAGEKSITLADGTYNVSDMAIFQNYAGKSLLIKAENEKQAVITPNSGSKQLIFVVAGMSKSYAGHITVDGLKFDMSGAANKEIESDVISISDAVGTNLPADEKALYSGTYHYGHDITVKNCEIIGLGSDNEHSSVVRTENQNAYNVKVQNCTIDKVGYVLASKISTLAEVSGCTITDSKCVINSTVNNTEYKIIGNTISSYNNYCIRLDYGPIEVKDNNFNITWTKETGEIPTKHEPAIVVLRNSTGNEATITGNTSSKADDTMYDIYCKTSWVVNGTTIPAENGLSF